MKSEGLLLLFGYACGWMVAGMAAMDGKLYVTGGHNGSPLSCGEVLDLSTMQWQSLPVMNTPRYNHGKWDSMP